MGKGILEVHVYADNIAQPVIGAKVIIYTENNTITKVSGESGVVEKVELEAPDIEYSLTPQEQVRPYSTCNIRVEKKGLRTTVIENVEILDTQTSIQDVYMGSLEDLEEEEEHIIIDEHALWADYPPKIVEEENGADHVSDLNGSVLPFPLVPEYIIVHNGIPTSVAANYYVPFIDYIKNVASSEIYSTWPKETIKANVYAIISFTLNRVYTEWYRARGYNFTITSSPAYDQKYSHDRTIFLTISRVVDEIFDTFIRRGTQQYPMFSQYNDGIKVNNSGWLSQWGSKTLGEQGQSALSILRHYYGSNINLKEAEVVEGLPNSFPGYILRNGSCGEPVQKLQAELNIIAGSYPAIPKINPVDGKFGPQTEAAVKKFQEVFNMSADGIVGFSTWYRISAIYVGVTKMIAGRSA